MTDSNRIRTAREACRRLGFELVATDDETAPIARPGANARSIFPGADPRPIALEPVGEPTPAAVLPAVGRAVRAGRTCLLVPDDEAGASELASLLRDPIGAKSVDGSGCRTFHAGVDRVHTDGGGLALYDAGDSFGRPDFEWYEEPGGGQRDRSGSDQCRLALAADGEPAAVLSGVEALRCPGPDPAAFAHRYRREADSLFHVYGAGNHQVGVFSGVTAMRERGFHPVPAPVVPEFHLPGPSDGAWGVLADGGETIRTANGAFEVPPASDGDPTGV
jgi:hypothetical protein